MSVAHMEHATLEELFNFVDSCGKMLPNAIKLDFARHIVELRKRCECMPQYSDNVHRAYRVYGVTKWSRQE